jgi:hypothetical protein
MQASWTEIILLSALWLVAGFAGLVILNAPVLP